MNDNVTTMPKNPTRRSLRMRTFAILAVGLLLAVPLVDGWSRPEPLRQAAEQDLQPHGHLRTDVAPAPTAAPGNGPIEFVCPTPQNGLLPPLPAGLGDDPVVYGCPIRVYDTGYSFGNPAIDINHQDHTEVAFFSLHGGPTRNGPDESARAGLTHVAFTSNDQGLTWEDQPTEQGQYRGAFGTFASGAMDSEGKLYAAYLWQQPTGDGYTGQIGLYKGPTTNERQGMAGTYGRGAYIEGRELGNQIERAHIIQMPSYVPPLETNESAPPSNETETGDAAMGDLANATAERMVAVWLERAVDWETSMTGMSAWIDAAYTHTGTHNDWTRLNLTQLIGPCKDFSNPVAWQAQIYVACVVERGYSDRARAHVGDIDMWRIDVLENTTHFVSTTNLVGGRPLLAVNEEGLMGLLTQRKVYDNEEHVRHLEVEIAYGWYGENWELRHGNIGKPLRRSAGGDEVPLLDADVTGFVLTTEENVGMITYKEWHDDPQTPEGIDPDEPGAVITNRLTDYNKFVIAFTPCEFAHQASRMELGTGVDSNNAAAYAHNPAVFNDKQDGLVVTRNAAGEELVYFAINDYGAMQYGAMVPVGTNQVCFFPPPIGLAAPLAVPQALAYSAGSTAMLASIVGVPAAAMVAYLLLSRKKAPSTVAAEDN